MHEYSMFSRCERYPNTKREQSVGMTYVPMQIWRDLIPNDIGFQKGTIFYELDKPFQR